MGKGYVYTIISLMFALVLLAIVSLYYESYRNIAEVDPAKIRTDELHYFVESSKKDISRAMAISGRRGAIYLVDYVVNNSAPLDDPENKLIEVIMNGTITKGSDTMNITQMQNHSLKFWIGRVAGIADKLNYNASISAKSMEIYHYGPWHFLEVITLGYNISDSKGTMKESCRYENPEIRLYSLVSIDGVEDPLYPLSTANKVGRYFTESSYGNNAELLSSGMNGNGTGGGMVFDLSSASYPSQNITEYYSLKPELVEYTVFVLEISNFNGLSQEARDILRSSGGVINYPEGPLEDMGFPYVSGLPEINFTKKNYVAIRNGFYHEIVWLPVNDMIQEKTYKTSAYGPCFFDRLMLKLSLSEKYANQSKELRDFLKDEPVPETGLESLVNVTEFSEYQLYESGILPAFTNQSSAEYRYFNDTSGMWVYGTPPWFRLDDEKMRGYNLTEFCCDPCLSASWSFDENIGDTIYDKTRNINNGIRHNATWTSGRSNNGLSFDGVDDFFEAEDSESLNASADITISMWVNPASNQTTHATLLSKHGNGGYVIEQNESNTNQFIFLWDTTGSGSWTGETASVTLKAGEWQHLAIVKTDVKVKYYLNGTEKVSGEGSSPFISPNGLDLRIGDRSLNGGRPFNGGIDEVRIWKRALTADEVRNEYEKTLT
ncbi:MAG: LamG domain-containing protein [Candidatus Altiarchaeota archaeon]|nr:LamG domain-containing protein [Candidatus Altiarchaeota archaeon]